MLKFESQVRSIYIGQFVVLCLFHSNFHFDVFSYRDPTDSAAQSATTADLVDEDA
jgi:hypothetical protein